MKRPSFQFYPGDWIRNANLQRCTHHEKSVWLHLMCLMHDADEYGILRWPLSEIALAVNCKSVDLKSLERKGVLKGADEKKMCEAFIFTPRHAGKDGQPVTLVEAQMGPIWYSSRMVKDEYVRTKRGIGTRFGDEPNGQPKPTIGDGIGDGPAVCSLQSSEGLNKDSLITNSISPNSADCDGSRNPPPTRAGLIAILLRGLGLKTGSTESEVVDWASKNVPDEILIEAVDEAKRVLGKPPNSSRYLVQIVDRLLNPQQKSGGNGYAKSRKYNPAEASLAEIEESERAKRGGDFEPPCGEIYESLRGEIYEHDKY